MSDAQLALLCSLLQTVLREESSLPEAEGALAQLNATGAWGALLARAAHEGVTPLLHRALAPYRSDVPPAAQAQLLAARVETAAANRALLDVLARVLRALERQGVAALALKGLALGAALYGDVALRPVGDLDLLVRAEQVGAAQDALGTLGYVPAWAEPAPGAMTELADEAAMVSTDPALGPAHTLDLHWHLAGAAYYRRQIDVSWFWETAVAARLEGVAVRTLGAEARLLYLCAHQALHHRGARLLWTCDIGRCVGAAGGPIDWQVFLDRAQAYGLVLPVRAMLAQAQAQLGAAVPAAAWDRLALAQPGRQEAAAYRIVGRARQSRLARFALDLAYLPGWRTKARLIRAKVFPSPAYMRQRYAVRRGWLLPAYYALRLGRGIVGAGGGSRRGGSRRGGSRKGGSRKGGSRTAPTRG